MFDDDDVGVIFFRERPLIETDKTSVRSVQLSH